MNTAYDWITVGVFAGLIVLFLQRSSGTEPPRDSIWQYLVASAGCAVVNWLGNQGYHWIAILAGVGVLAYIYFVLRPFERPGA